MCWPASYSDRNHRRSFKGLYLDQIGFVYSTQSWIASGEPRSMTVVGSATQSKKSTAFIIWYVY